MERILLISRNKYELPGVKQSSTFMNIDLDDVDCVVFNSSTDDDFSVIRDLKEAKDKNKKIIYINKNINPLFYCILMGLDADIYDSEDYLLDLSILGYLVESYKDTNMTITRPSEDLETLAKIISAITDNPVETIKNLSGNQFWLRTLKTSVDNVDTAISRSSESNIRIVDMLEASYDLIRSLEESQEATSSELEKLKTLINDYEKRNSRTNTPYLFGSYSVPVHINKTLYIKAHSDCRYLKSFIIAYQHYLQMSKQTSSKVLFCFPKLKNLVKKYSQLGTRLAQDSILMLDYQSDSIFTTFEPKKAVMDAFFGLSADVFIVVDIMYDEDVVDKATKKLHAVGGVSDITRLNLEPQDTIMPIVQLKGGITLTHIPKYVSANESSKKAMYYKHCQEAFERLDEYTL